MKNCRDERAITACVSEPLQIPHAAHPTTCQHREVWTGPSYPFDENQIKAFPEADSRQVDQDQTSDAGVHGTRCEGLDGLVRRYSGPGYRCSVVEVQTECDAITSDGTADFTECAVPIQASRALSPRASLPGSPRDMRDRQKTQRHPATRESRATLPTRRGHPATGLRGLRRDRLRTVRSLQGVRYTRARGSAGCRNLSGPRRPDSPARNARVAPREHERHFHRADPERQSTARDCFHTQQLLCTSIPS